MNFQTKNSEMKPNRYGIWALARKRHAAIVAALAAGDEVRFIRFAPFRPVHYRGKAHVASFKATENGLFVARGKYWNAVLFEGLRAVVIARRDGGFSRVM